MKPRVKDTAVVGGRKEKNVKLTEAQISCLSLTLDEAMQHLRNPPLALQYKQILRRLREAQ